LVNKEGENNLKGIFDKIIASCTQAVVINKEKPGDTVHENTSTPSGRIAAIALAAPKAAPAPPISNFITSIEDPATFKL
jgi:hypothetical protein